MGDLDFSVRLSASDEGLVGELRVTQQELDKLKTDLKQTGNEADNAGKKNKKLADSFKFLHKDVLTLKTAFAGLGLGLLGREVIQAGVQWDKYRIGLKAVTGTHQAAAEEIVFLRSEAERLGLTYDALIPSYTKLAAAAKGTSLQGENTRKIFTAVAEASRVMGLSSQEAEGALLAISQMMSKGNVQAEELRGQLGERLPGAFQMAARAMGVTTSQLNDMLDNGQVLADDLLPKLADEISKTFGDGLEDAVGGAQAEMARFDNAMNDLAATVSTDLMPYFIQFTRFMSSEFIPAMVWAAQEVGILDKNFRNMTTGNLMVELEDINAELSKQQRIWADGNLLLKQNAGERINELLAEREKIMDVIAARKKLNELANSDPDYDPEKAKERAIHKTNFDALFAETRTGRKQAAYEEYGAAIKAINASKVDGIVKTEMLALAEKKLSDVINEGANEAEKAAEREAAAQARTSEEAAKAAARKLKSAQDYIKQVKRSAMTEVQLEKDKYTQIRKELAEHLDAMNATQEERREAEAAAEDAHQQRLADIHKREQDKIRKENERTGEEFKNIMEGWGTSFTDTLADMVFTGKASFSDLLQSIAMDIFKFQVNQNIVKPFIDSASSGGFDLGSLFGGVGDFFADLFHEGGVAGYAKQYRAVDPSAFIGAPRYHTGIGPNERAAVIRKDEGVFTPEQMKALAPAGMAAGPQSISIEWENKGQPGQVSQANAQLDVRGMVIKVVTEDVQRGGPIRGSMQRTFNLQAAGG